MKKIKNILNYILIDGLSGMALGLFGTLIIGTILAQIASFIPGVIGKYIGFASSVTKSITGAGIGIGMAAKYKSSPLTSVSAAVSGMVGAFASALLKGTLITETGALLYSGPGDPLGAFVAAFTAIQIGKLISGKTKLDIILTPALSILAGSAVGIVVGPYLSKFMTWLGEIIKWSMDKQPLIFGIIVSVVMGICLTLPISSAALGIILGLDGIVGGAAVVGCCCQMVGFAVASFRENKVGGLVSQGIGTSMLQMPNILKHPQIWIPPIISSAILGPISTVVLQMKCDTAGSGMGTSGLVGQFMTYSAMTADGVSPTVTIIEIVIMHFIAPAILTLIVSEFMRKKDFIKFGDMSLDDIA